MTLGEINEAYRITYTTEDADLTFAMTPGHVKVTNEAQLFNENVLIAEWEETVTVAYTEHRIEKGVRDPNFPSNSISINWLFVVLGLLTKSIETASAFTFPMLFLPYLRIEGLLK